MTGYLPRGEIYLSWTTLFPSPDMRVDSAPPVVLLNNTEGVQKKVVAVAVGWFSEAIVKKSDLFYLDFLPQRGKGFLLTLPVGGVHIKNGMALIYVEYYLENVKNIFPPYPTILNLTENYIVSKFRISINHSALKRFRPNLYKKASRWVKISSEPQICTSAKSHFVRKFSNYLVLLSTKGNPIVSLFRDVATYWAIQQFDISFRRFDVRSFYIFFIHPLKPKALIQTVPSLFDERSTVIIVTTYKKYSLRPRQFHSYHNVYNTIKQVSFY